MATLEAAYRFLVFAYTPGDEIHLVGFSRGAFMARLLAGLLRTCGILERPHAGEIGGAIALYRRRRVLGGPDGPAARTFRARFAGHATTGPHDARRRKDAGLAAGAPLAAVYLGVWDTVGALGSPAASPSRPG